MSKAEREMKAFLEGVDSQFYRPMIFDGAAFIDTMNKREKEREEMNACAAAQEAERKYYEEIAKNHSKSEEEMGKAFQKDSKELQAMLTHIKTHINASIKRENNFKTIAKGERKDYEHLADLHDIDYMELREAKVERTKAELIEDYEAVEKINKEIKNIEERLLFYSEQMKLIEAEEN